MRLTPARLLRLYPGLWRLRYGPEFLALLESAPITRAIVRDVVRSAAREWLTRTRLGRVFLGLVVAQAAYLCAFGAAWVLSPRWFVEPFRIDSFSSLIIMIISGSGPLVVGSLLILAKTRADRRYEWFGLRHQLIAFFFADAWAEWTGLAYRIGSPASLSFEWHVLSGGALTVIWMLLLLFNVDRRRESFSPWHKKEEPKVPRLGTLGIFSDRY